MTRPVFVSYATADRQAAEAIRDAVERRGIPCWMAPRDVPPGAEWGAAIVDAIEAAKVMLLVFSRSANNSDAIKKEVVLAGQARIDVIPLMIEDITPSGHFRYELATRQWINLFAGWDREMDRLVNHLSGLAAPVVAEPVAPETPKPERHRSEPVPPGGPVPVEVPEASVRRSLPRRGLLVGAGGLAVGGSVLAYELSRTLSPQPLVQMASPEPAKQVTRPQPEVPPPDPLAGMTLTPGVFQSDGVNAVAISPDGALIATAHVAEVAMLWDRTSGRLLRRFEGHSGWVRAVAFAPDGRTLATGSDDNTARLWDPGTGRETRRFEGHSSYVYAVAFAPDGRALATGSWDTTSRLWDPATGRETRRFEGHSSFVLAVAFAPDGRVLATGSYDNTARLWDPATGHETRRFEGHSSSVSAVAFAPDGSELATASGDGTIRLWDVRSGRELVRIYHLDGDPQLIIYGDGKSYWGTSNIDALLALVQGLEARSIPDAYRARYFGPKTLADVRHMLGLSDT